MTCGVANHCSCNVLYILDSKLSLFEPRCSGDVPALTPSGMECRQRWSERWAGIQTKNVDQMEWNRNGIQTGWNGPGIETRWNGIETGWDGIPTG